MKDNGAALDQPGGAMGVGEIAQDHLDLIFDRGRQQFQQAPIIPGIIARQGPDVGAQLHQPFHQMTADESPGAGHQHALPLPMHKFILYSYLQVKSRVRRG